MAIVKMFTREGVGCGYCAEETMFFNGLPLNPIPILKSTKVKKEEAKRAVRKEARLGVLVYGDLPVYRDSNGRCTNCGRCPDEEHWASTDQGLQQLVYCSFCDNVMRRQVFDW